MLSVHPPRHCPTGSRQLCKVAARPWPDPVTASHPGEENGDICPAGRKTNLLRAKDIWCCASFFILKGHVLVLGMGRMCGPILHTLLLYIHLLGPFTVGPHAVNCHTHLRGIFFSSPQGTRREKTEINRPLYELTISNQVIKFLALSPVFQNGICGIR